MYMVSNVSVSEEKINISSSLPLSSHSFLKTGGRAREAAFPQDADDVLALIRRNPGKRIRAVGGLSNTLVSDDGFDGLLLIMTHMKGITIDGETLTCAAGEKPDSVIRAALEAGLEGMEAFAGLPGTMGGAVAGNAGAEGMSISDILRYADALTADGTAKRIESENYLFSYRSSPFSDDDIITSICLGLKKSADIAAAKERANAIRRSRAASGQFAFPSLGCVFRNPEGDAAGRIIDSLGLKGFAHGGARVSENHANVILNTGNATSSDYLSLAEEVRRIVLERTGIRLEYEIRFLG